jgi:hypothetical protein
MRSWIILKDINMIKLTKIWITIATRFCIVPLHSEPKRANPTAQVRLWWHLQYTRGWLITTITVLLRRHHYKLQPLRKYWSLPVHYCVLHLAAIQCSNTPLISDNISHVLMKFNPTVMLQPAYNLTRNTVGYSTPRPANGCGGGSKRVFF